MPPEFMPGGFRRAVSGPGGPDEFPSFIDDPVAWNASWEAMAPGLSGMHGGWGPQYGEITEPFLVEYRSCFQQLCFLQQNLSAQTDLCFRLGFKRTWQGTTVEVRKKHMLEGHVRTCIMSEDDSQRSICGDITLEGLAKDGGKGFLDLLQFYHLDNSTSTPTSPTLYPYPGTTCDPASTDPFAFGRDMYICERPSPMDLRYLSHYSSRQLPLLYTCVVLQQPTSRASKILRKKLCQTKGCAYSQRGVDARNRQGGIQGYAKTDAYT